MIEFYVQVKSLHVISVVLSGSLFMLRGVLMLTHSRNANHAAVRYLSYTIDTVLLTTALMLVSMLHAYPFVQHWLTVKVVLLVVYIVLGTLALTRGHTSSVQVGAYVAALRRVACLCSV